MTRYDHDESDDPNAATSNVVDLSHELALAGLWRDVATILARTTMRLFMTATRSEHSDTKAA